MGNEPGAGIWRWIWVQSIGTKWGGRAGINRYKAFEIFISFSGSTKQHTEVRLPL